MHLLIFVKHFVWHSFFIAMKAKKSVNQNSNSELTIEKLRTYKGFENFTEEQAQIAIINIKRLAKILFGIYSKDNPSNAS